MRASNRHCTVSWRIVALDGSTYLQVDFDAKKDWTHRSPDGTCADSGVHAWPRCSSLDRISSAVLSNQVEAPQPVLIFVPEAVVVCRVRLSQPMSNRTGRRTPSLK